MILCYVQVLGTKSGDISAGSAPIFDKIKPDEGSSRKGALEQARQVARSLAVAHEETKRATAESELPSLGKIQVLVSQSRKPHVRGDSWTETPDTEEQLAFASRYEFVILDGNILFEIILNLPVSLFVNPLTFISIIRFQIKCMPF